MGHHHRTGPRRDVRENEEYPQPIMGQETDVPWVLDEAGRRSRGETPSHVNAQVCAGEDEDRIHVAKHVKGEIDARSDLKGTEAVARRRGVPPDKIEPSADLKEKKCDQERLQYLGSIDMTEDLHHRVIGAGAEQRGEMVGNVECNEYPDDDERR